jgi:hypothetical protein
MNCSENLPTKFHNMPLGACFKAFMAMFQVKVLWVVMPCSVVVGYHRFGGHAAYIFSDSQIMVSHHNTTWRHHQKDLSLKEATCFKTYVVCQTD